MKLLSAVFLLTLLIGCKRHPTEFTKMELMDYNPMDKKVTIMSSYMDLRLTEGASLCSVLEDGGLSESYITEAHERNYYWKDLFSQIGQTNFIELHSLYFEYKSVKLVDETVLALETLDLRIQKIEQLRAKTKSINEVDTSKLTLEEVSCLDKMVYQKANSNLLYDLRKLVVSQMDITDLSIIPLYESAKLFHNETLVALPVMIAEVVEMVNTSQDYQVKLDQLLKTVEDIKADYKQYVDLYFEFTGNFVHDPLYSEISKFALQVAGFRNDPSAVVELLEALSGRLVGVSEEEFN